MVEVIKHGDKNITECDFCGAQLRYSVEDIKKREKIIILNYKVILKDILYVLIVTAK